jgi:hypothetical protein
MKTIAQYVGRRKIAQPGTDVMVFKYFRRKIQQKNWRFKLKKG